MKYNMRNFACPSWLTVCGSLCHPQHSCLRVCVLCVQSCLMLCTHQGPLSMEFSIKYFFPDCDSTDETCLQVSGVTYTFFKTSLCSTDQRQSWLHRKYSTNTSSLANFHTNTSLTGNTSNCLLSHNPLKVYWAWRNLSTTEVKIFVLKSVPSLPVNSPAII